MGKKFIKESIEKINSVIWCLQEIANDDYNYDRDIQDLTDLRNHLECRYNNYTENDELKK